MPMRAYRARELLMVPSLVSLTRVPLAFAFAWFVDRPVAALGLLTVAGITDVFDGWYARRFDQVTTTGTLVDPVTDKFFVLVVVVTLMLTQQLDVGALLLLSTRELGELPLVLWLAVSPRERRLRKEHPSANLPGKAATLFQFASVGAVLMGSQYLPALLWITGAIGAAAALTYWHRALTQRRTSRR